MDFPILRNLLLYRPTHIRWLGYIFAFLLFPVAIPVYLVGNYQQKHLRHEISVILHTGKEIMLLLEKEEKEQTGEKEDIQ